MTSNVFDLQTGARKQTGDEFLEAHKGRFQEVMLIGFDEDGAIAFGANCISTRDAVFLLEIVKRELLENLD